MKNSPYLDRSLRSVEEVLAARGAAERPWFKISHASHLPGTSLVTKWPRKGHERVNGRWYVFDKNVSNFPHLFDAETIEECHAWVAQQEGK